MALKEGTLTPMYVTRAQVDEIKWNRCIEASINKLAYGYASYLDHMSPGWSAIVLGDYEMVMPLTWRKKWGIRYLYQPAFTQQLGLFFAHQPDAQTWTDVIRICKENFRFAEIAINYLNQIEGSSPRNNFVLDLVTGYDQIRTAYKNDLLNNLKVAGKHRLVYSDGNASVIIKTFRHEYRKRLPQISDADYRSFEQFCTTTRDKVRVICRQVVDEADNLVCGAVLLATSDRLILNACVTTAAGKQKRATHFLLDELIREFSGTEMLFDFEGSDIPGIASFYKNFCPINQPYYFLRYNHLPFPINLLKKS